MLTIGKASGLAAPFVLKWVIELMTPPLIQVTFKPIPIQFKKVFLGLIAWSLTKAVSSILNQNHMYQITKVCQDGLMRISSTAFSHMHSLDLNFHK